MKYSYDVKVARDNCFATEKWNDVPTKYWPVYAWAWGAPLSKEEIKSKMEEMYKIGIRGVYPLPMPKNFRPRVMPTTLEPDYLTDEYFEMYAYVVECAKELGMQLFLYDEGGWPSGSACGKVVEKNPHLLRMKFEKVEKASPYTPSENAVAAYANGKRVKAGEESEYPITEYVLVPVLSPNAPPFPNVSQEGATECFLELTHEGYKKHLGEEVFGKEITMAFTDEVGVYLQAWTDNMAEEFKQRYGYDICDYLPQLVDDKFETDEEKDVACDYYDLLSERLARNYYLKLREWCRENNIYSTGHLNGEDETINCTKTGFNHALRQLRCFDVPGIDVIWRQIFPGQKNHFFPRLASSAANQIGSPMTITETFGVYGAGLTLDQTRYVTMHQMVRGINLINSAGLTYKLEGVFMTGIRPYYSTDMPTWEHLYQYNKYVSKMSYLMNIGKAETDYAIYMPMRDMWPRGEGAEKAAGAFDSLAFYLEEKHCQFDIIDDDFLETAILKNGTLSTGDAAYKSIIIPECSRIPENSKKVLSEFEKCGGEVIFGNAPENIRPVAKIKGKKAAILKKTFDDGKIYLVVNEDTEKDLMTIEFSEKGNIYFLDAETGGIYELDSIKDMPFASGEGRAFLVTDKTYDAQPYREATREIMSLTNFEAKRLSKFVIGEKGFGKEEFSEDYSPVALGDWCRIYGNDFSGKVSYRTSFMLDNITDIMLDLGDVKYSCEVIVNGESIGICIANPFALWIDKKYLKKENEIEIIVANTSANQYVNTKVFDSWEDKAIGPYHKIATEFEKESLESGLFGPVKIFV